MTKYEVLYIAMPFVVAALGWLAVLIFEWHLRREDRAHSEPPAP